MEQECQFKAIESSKVEAVQEPRLSYKSVLKWQQQMSTRAEQQPRLSKLFQGRLVLKENGSRV